METFHYDGRGGKGIQRETFSVKYSSAQHHRSSCASGHNKLRTITMVTGQTKLSTSQLHQCHVFFSKLSHLHQYS